MNLNTGTLPPTARRMDGKRSEPKYRKRKGEAARNASPHRQQNYSSRMTTRSRRRRHLE